MLEIVITLKDLINSRRAAKKPVTRLVEFPDGITRHITLPGWKWAVLDRFDRPETLISSARVISFAFDGAVADAAIYVDDTFEDLLRYHLSICLDEAVAWSSDYAGRRSNDC